MVFEQLYADVGRIPLFYEQVLFLAALAGAGAGGYIDLKTTEIPDIIPASMALIGILVHSYLAYSLSSISYLLWPVAVALGYLVFGYAMYFTGQWGEADVLILAAVGFLVPYPLSFLALSGTAGIIYPITYLANTFVVGGVYSLIYAAVHSARTEGFYRRYSDDLKSNTKSLRNIIVVSSLALLAFLLIVAGTARLPFVFVLRMLSFFIPFVTIVFLFYRFAHVVDSYSFRRQVPSGMLREGDVLAESLSAKGVAYSSKLFIGLGNDDIQKIRAAFPGKKIWIKEGIRYGPAFFLTLLSVWLLGDVLFLLMGIL